MSQYECIYYNQGHCAGCGGCVPEEDFCPNCGLPTVEGLAGFCVCDGEGEAE